MSKCCEKTSNRTSTIDLCYKRIHTAVSNDEIQDNDLRWLLSECLIDSEMMTHKDAQKVAALITAKKENEIFELFAKKMGL